MQSFLSEHNANHSEEVLPHLSTARLDTWMQRRGAGIVTKVYDVFDLGDQGKDLPPCQRLTTSFQGSHKYKKTMSKTSLFRKRLSGTLGKEGKGDGTNLGPRATNHSSTT